MLQAKPAKPAQSDARPAAFACSLTFLAMLLALFQAVVPLPARAAEAVPPPLSESLAMPLRIWEQNGLEVFAIQDSPGQLDISQFKGPATPEERAKYFTNGKTRADTNVFLLRAGLKNILVDSGLGVQAPGQSRLLEQLLQFGLEPGDVDAVLLSHMHPDHIGGLIDESGLAVFPNALLLLSGVECDYWTALAQEPQKDQPPSVNARLAMQTLDAYSGRVRLFMSGPLDDALGLPDASILALPAFGHTPGHTVFSLGVYEPRLLIIGDTIHAASLQFALPQECAVYDLDRRAASFVRESILSLAAETSALVAGMHLPFPACGRGIRESKGFRFEAVKY